MVGVPWWIKLWWHGVDIAASVISTLFSTLIVWFFARLFLRQKHDAEVHLERRKVEARAEIEERLRVQKELDSNRQAFDKWKQEREQFAQEYEQISTYSDAASLILKFSECINQKGLMSNELERQYEFWQECLNNGTALNSNIRSQIANAMREVHLPDEREFYARLTKVEPDTLKRFFLFKNPFRKRKTN